jgi:hypothetical protein
MYSLKLGDYTNVYGDISDLCVLRKLHDFTLGGTKVTGDIASLAGLPSSCVSIDCHSNKTDEIGIYGDIGDLASLTQVSTWIIGNTYVEGALSDMFPEVNPNVGTLYLWESSVNITGDLSVINAKLPNLANARFSWLNLAPAALDNLPKLWFLDLGNCDYSEADVDQILAYVYAARMINTSNSAHYLLLAGGTSATPSGTYEDVATPSAGLEYAYKLHNDPDEEGFKTWANITWNGGQAT